MIMYDLFPESSKIGRRVVAFYCFSYSIFYDVSVCASHQTHYTLLFQRLERGRLGDIRLLESIQKRWTRQVAGVGHL